LVLHGDSHTTGNMNKIYAWKADLCGSSASRIGWANTDSVLAISWEGLIPCTALSTALSTATISSNYAFQAVVTSDGLIRVVYKKVSGGEGDSFNCSSV